MRQNTSCLRYYCHKNFSFKLLKIMHCSKIFMSGKCLDGCDANNYYLSIYSVAVNSGIFSKWTIQQIWHVSSKRKSWINPNSSCGRSLKSRKDKFINSFSSQLKNFAKWTKDFLSNDILCVSISVHVKKKKAGKRNLKIIIIIFPSITGSIILLETSGSFFFFLWILTGWDLDQTNEWY